MRAHAEIKGRKFAEIRHPEERILRRRDPAVAGRRAVRLTATRFHRHDHAWVTRASCGIVPARVGAFRFGRVLRLTVARSQLSTFRRIERPIATVDADGAAEGQPNETDFRYDEPRAIVPHFSPPLSLRGLPPAEWRQIEAAFAR